jgi:hypothetical protein
MEPLEQPGGPPPAFGPAQVMQVGHEDQVLLPGEQLVHRGELAGDTDRRADQVWVGGRVVASHPGGPTVCGEQGGQDADCGRLARAVGPQQREHRAFGHVQVDAVEHCLLAKGLAEAPDRDR